MPHLVSALFLSGVSVFAAAQVKASADVLEVIIANGPDAGSYRTPNSDLICMNSPKNNVYAATWKNLDDVIKDMYGAQGERKKVGAKVLDSASIRVLNPNDLGTKLGDVSIELRNQDPTKNRTYEIKSAPLTLTIKGQGAEISFDGKTKDGIHLRVIAECSEMIPM